MHHPRALSAARTEATIRIERTRTDTHVPVRARWIIFFAAAALAVLVTCSWPWRRRESDRMTALSSVARAEVASGARPGEIGPKREIVNAVYLPVDPTDPRWDVSLYRRGKDLRWDSRSGAFTDVECRSGGRWWRDLNGVVMSLRAAKPADRAADQATDPGGFEPGLDRIWLERARSWLKHCGQPGYGVQILPPRKMPDGSVFPGIRVRAPGRKPQELFFDPATHRLAAVRYQITSADEPAGDHYIIRFQDWRADGRAAYSWRRPCYFNGRLADTVCLRSVDTTSPVPDSLFRKPVSDGAPAAATVPLYYVGLPFVDVRINGGAPHRFMLDTGCGVTMISPRLANQLGLHPKPDRLAVFAGSRITFRSAHVNVVAVGPAVIHDLAVEVTSGADAANLAWKGAEGLLGFNFLGHFQFTVDLGRQLLTLAPRTSRDPAGSQSALGIGMAGLYTAAEIDGESDRFLVDTGANVVKAPWDLVSQVRHGPVLDGGYRSDERNVGHTVITRVRSVCVGSDCLPDFPVYVRLPPGTPPAGDVPFDPETSLGDSFLEHYVVTVDPERQLLILRPSAAAYNDTWTGPGFDIISPGPGHYPFVYVVFSGSPAAAAGIRVGDKLVAVEGLNAGATPPWRLWNALRGAAGSSVEVSLRRGVRLTRYRLRRTRLLEGPRR